MLCFSLTTVCLSSPSAYGTTPYNLGVEGGALAECSSGQSWLEASAWKDQHQTPLACLARNLCGVELSIKQYVVPSLSVEVYAEELRFPETSIRKLWV